MLCSISVLPLGQPLTPRPLVEIRSMKNWSWQPPSVMQIMVGARTLGNPLAHMWSRWVLELSPGVPSFRDSSPYPPLRLNTSLQWRLARKLSGCATYWRRWASLLVLLWSCALTTSLPSRYTASISPCFMTKHCKKNRRKRYSFIYNFVWQKRQIS